MVQALPSLMIRQQVRMRELADGPWPLSVLPVLSPVGLERRIRIVIILVDPEEMKWKWRLEGALVD